MFVAYVVLYPVSTFLPLALNVPPIIVKRDFAHFWGENCGFFAPIVMEPPVISKETSESATPSQRLSENVVAPSAIVRLPSARVTATSNVLTPVHVQPSGASMLNSPVPVMLPPKVPEPCSVPPETVNVPMPTGERPSGGKLPAMTSVPPESVVPPSCELAGLSLAVPGPTTSTAVPPVKSDRTLVVVPSGGSMVTASATTADAESATPAIEHRNTQHLSIRIATSL